MTQPTAPVPKRVRIPAAVLFQEIEGEAVLMHTGKESYFTLDPVGTTIWKLLMASPDDETTRAHLLETYEVPAEVAERDLKEFVARLLEAGLLEPDS
ncbi:MAG: PqqD family protein [Gemmatimonadales bacterium]